jgi:glycosyltransferase involved in cell wall biosynthesis
MVDQQTYDDKEGWIALFEDPEKRPFDHFIATNNRIRDAYLTRFGIPDEKITVILSGINTEAFREVLPLEHEGVAGLRLRLSLPDRGRVFAFIGRLVEQKRPLDYLALARQAQKEGGDGTFVLVGQGKLQEDCAKFVEEHGLENVRLLEHCEFPLHLFSLVDGLILTSAYEGLPLVAQEAMCLGIPVLATDVGEIVPVFAKYQVGRLFRDSPDEASRYEDFRSWSQQIDLEKARSAAPVCRIQEDFSSKRVALEYRNCWEQAIQRHAAGRETQGAALTVIIPTYNRASLLEKTVRRCLDCAGEVRLEILVVDDGSTDTTAEVMSRLMEEEGGAVRYLRLSNGGPARARNAGADQAAHPVLLFMGDDVWPTNQDFFSAHALLHKANPAEDFAVLGKMEWPADPEMPVNFVMAHIQGEGGEQFAYDRIEPFSKVDWRYFYTSNVSVKKGLVGDWLKEGFSRDFPHAAFEDSEFAWRLRKQGRELDLRYCPTSVGAHLHAYNAEQFMRRQYLCGKMAVIFARMHPEVADGVGLVELKAALHKDSEGASAADPAHYAAVVQGLRSYLVLLESRADWGAYPWHRALLSAVFELAYFQGYLEGVDQPGLNQQNAYAWMLQRFASRLRKSANDRVVQDFIMGTLMSGPSK